MARLILLGLLRRKPMHGYEMQQLIQMSRLDLWANVLPGSIYYALNKMEDEGLVRTLAEERTGARLRKIFGITEKGEEAFQEELKRSLVVPPHSVKSDFSVALALIEGLPKEEALRLLSENLRSVRETRDQWRLGQQLKGEAGVSEVVKLTFENTIERIELDVRYLEKVIELLKKS